MDELPAFRSSDGGVILVGTSSLSSGSVTRGGRAESAVIEAARSLDQAVGHQPCDCACRRRSELSNHTEMVQARRSG